MAYDTSNPNIHKGIVFHRQGQFQQAIECFQECLRTESGNIVPWNLMAYSLLGLMQREKALECFDRAVEIDPKDVPTWNGKAKCLYELGRHAEAIPWFDRYLREKPQSAEAWNFLGSCHVATGALDRALSCFDNATAADPNVAMYWANKGSAQAEMGRHAEAIDCYARARQLDPLMAVVWYNQATSEEALGRESDAIESFKRFLAASPQGFASQAERAQKSIDRLQRESAPTGASVAAAPATQQARVWPDGVAGLSEETPLIAKPGFNEQDYLKNKWECPSCKSIGNHTRGGVALLVRKLPNGVPQVMELSRLECACQAVSTFWFDVTAVTGDAYLEMARLCRPDGIFVFASGRDTLPDEALIIARRHPEFKTIHGPNGPIHFGGV